MKPPVMTTALLLALTGCPQKPPTPESTRPPKATPQQCSQVADHLVGLMVKSVERTEADTEADTETADAIRRMFDERCVADGWGPDVHDCFTKLNSMADVGKRPCEEYLTIDQRNNLDKALDDLFGGKPKPDSQTTPPTSPTTGS